MTDPAYQRLGLPETASPYAVLRAAVPEEQFEKWKKLLISSKWEIAVNRIRVVQETRDSINEGIYNKHLNFQY